MAVRIRGTVGYIYDPVANTWTNVAPPSGWSNIGDSPSVILVNGSYIQSSCCDNPPTAAILNPSTLTWTSTGTGKFDIYDEEGMTLLARRHGAGCGCLRLRSTRRTA